MAEYYGGLDRGYINGDSVEIKKGTAVSLSATDPTKVEITTTTNAARYIGVTTSDAGVGEQITIRFQGIAEVVVSEAIAIGDSLAVGVAGGKVKKAATGANYCIGKALTAAAADGGWIEVFLSFWHEVLA